MRRMVLLITLLVARGANAQANGQPENSSEFICSTEDEAERLGQLIEKEGLASKGVEAPTSYCLADVKIMWQACAKSKGVKRRKWCELVISYCREINRQLDAAHNVRVRRLEREEEERLRQAKEDRERMKRGADYESSVLIDLMGPLADMATKPFDQMTPPARELQPSQCYGLPEPEGSKPKGNPSAPSGNSSPFFFPSGPTPMATPLPSYGGGSPRMFEASPSRDTSRCLTNKITCSNGCDNVPDYGSGDGKIFAIRRRCNDVSAARTPSSSGRRHGSQWWAWQTQKRGWRELQLGVRAG